MIFVQKLTLSGAYDSLDIRVILSESWDNHPNVIIYYGFIMVFFLTGCQGDDINMVKVKTTYSELTSSKHIDQAYYLSGTTLSYSITVFHTSFSIPKNSSDCLAVLVIFDDQELYLEFFDAGVHNNSLSVICINDYKTSKTVIFKKNSYYSTGLYVYTSTNEFTFNIKISGTVYKYDIKKLRNNLYGKCETYNSVDNCTIQLEILEASTSTEFCLLAVVEAAALRSMACTTLLIFLSLISVFILL